MHFPRDNTTDRSGCSWSGTATSRRHDGHVLYLQRFLKTAKECAERLSVSLSMLPSAVHSDPSHRRGTVSIFHSPVDGCSPNMFYSDRTCLRTAVESVCCHRRTCPSLWLSSTRQMRFGRQEMQVCPRVQPLTFLSISSLPRAEAE